MVRHVPRAARQEGVGAGPDARVLGAAANHRLVFLERDERDESKAATFAFSRAQTFQRGVVAVSPRGVARRGQEAAS